MSEDDLNNFNIINGGEFTKEELVFNKNKEGGIYSGGFDVKSIMMKAGISPITTLNQNGGKLGGNNVSDLFDSLVLPYWATYHPTTGGKNNKHIDEDDEDDKDDIIEEDIHDKLLNLVKEHTKNDKNDNKNKTTKKEKKNKKEDKKINKHKTKKNKL